MSVAQKWTVTVDFKYADLATARNAFSALSGSAGWSRITTLANTDGTFAMEIARTFAALNDAFTWITQMVTQAGLTGVTLKTA